MKSIKVLPLLIAFLVAQITKAQDSSTHSTLSLGIGINRLLNKDEFYSPFTYRGTQFLLHSSYTRMNARGMHKVDFNYSKGTIQSIVSLAGLNHLFHVNYTYLHRIQGTAPNLSLYAGAGVSAFLNKSNYLPRIEQPKSYLTGNASFVVAAKAIYSLNAAHTISVYSSLPIIGMTYRPDFEVNGKEYLGESLIFNRTWFSGSLQYEYALNTKYKVMLAYQYRYFTYEKPRSISIMENVLIVGIKRSF